jgi:hypothetical protein
MTTRRQRTIELLPIGLNKTDVHALSHHSRVKGSGLLTALDHVRQLHYLDKRQRKGVTVYRTKVRSAENAPDGGRDLPALSRTTRP